MNIKLELFGLIYKQTQVLDVLGLLEILKLIASLLKISSHLYNPKEKLLEFMLVPICGLKFSEVKLIA